MKGAAVSKYFKGTVPRQPMLTGIAVYCITMQRNTASVRTELHSLTSQMLPEAANRLQPHKPEHKPETWKDVESSVAILCMLRIPI